MEILRTTRRRLFHTAAAVSTLLLLATVILWPVSYYRVLEVGYVHNGGPPGIEGNLIYVDGKTGRAIFTYKAQMRSSREGSLNTIYAPDYSGDQFHCKWSYLAWMTPDPGPTSFEVDNILGLKWVKYPPSVLEAGRGYPPGILRELAIPFLAFRSIRRQRRSARLGLCPKCSYDLRAHAPGSACPECGTPVASSPRPGAGS
jgi:hypothetical protein